MVKVGLLAYIALWSSASSAAPTENDNIFDERACTVPANLLTNPGFESGLGKSKKNHMFLNYREDPDD